MMQQSDVLNAILRERRSVKPGFFNPEALIPDEVILQALTNATWAPNHGKTEPWHFTVYKGDGINRLAAFQSELYKQKSGDKFSEAKYINLKEGYTKASHVIAICYRRDPASRIPQVEEIAAVAAAVQNLALTLHAYGYGGYWTTGGITYYEEAKPFLDLGANDMLMGFYLCGVPASTPPSTSRIPINEKMNWVE